jgi:hypothetical protein
MRYPDGMGDLLRSITRGFGWKVGTKLAKEAIEDVKEALGELGEDPKENETASARPPPADPAKLEAEREARAKEQARRAKATAEEAARREREIDVELAELKERVAKGR